MTVGLLAWTTPKQHSDAQKYMETRAKMEKISEAIRIFRTKRNRLPCPADPYMRSDGTRDSSGGTDYYVNSFGLEDLDTTQTAVNGKTTLGTDCPSNIGAVPVYALGLDGPMIEDAWQRRFTYQVSDNLCGEDQGTTTLSTLESISRGCTPQDYNDRVGDIAVKDISGTTLTPKAAYVIVSHGPNGKGAFLPSGVKLSGASGNELTNSSNSGDEKDLFIKDKRTSSFDDVVLFKTRRMLERLKQAKEENL